MKRKILAFVLMFAMILSLCSCFPSKGKQSENGKITIEQLASQPKHIKETPFENFTIDSDINIYIKNALNIYQGTLNDYNIKTLQEIFSKNVEIINTYDDGEGFSSIEWEDGSCLSRNSGLDGATISYSTKELSQRELPFYYISDSGNLRIKQDRNELFPMKELDFMSSADAISIVDEIMKKLNIPVARYAVYPVDYEYIKKKDEADLAQYVEENPKNFYVQHTKDDEFYLIIPRLMLPNGSELGEVFYRVPDAINKEIKSGEVFAVVNKNGLVSFDISGVYTYKDENETVQGVISAEQAVATIKNKYTGVQIQNPHTIYQIELSYMPYLITDDSAYAVKPTWLFTLRYEQDGTVFKKQLAVDAVTGAEVRMS